MLKVYLDTQDYAHLYKEDISPDLVETKRRLLAFERAGLVKFPLSFLTLFEFVQDYESEHETDREKRSVFLSEICGNETLPYFLDLALKNKPIDEESWLPFGAIRNFSVEHMFSVLRYEIKQKKGIPRSLRRDLQNPLVLRSFLKNYLQSQNSENLNSTNWNPELENFYFDFFKDYLLGIISEQEANRRFRESVFEPAKFFSIWYQRFSNKNALKQFHGEAIEKFYQGSVLLHQKVPILVANLKEARSKFKSSMIAVSESSRKLENLGIAMVPCSMELPPAPDFDEFYSNSRLPETLMALVPDIQSIFRAYHKGLYDGQFTPQKSDIIDIFHSVYIDRVDLWRTDKSFADFLARANIFPKKKIVVSLNDLPNRIDKLLEDKT